MDVIKEMLTKSWWQSVPAKDFHGEIARVLPSFNSPLVRNAKKSAITKKAKNKAEEKIDLGAHLAEIKTIAKSESKNNTIQPDESLKDMTEDEVLRHFIKFEKSEVHTAKLSVKEKEKDKIQTIFEHFGTDLSSRKRFTSDRTYPAKSYFDEEDYDPGREDD